MFKGLCQSNEFISRDEGLHCDFACLLYSMLSKKLDESVVHTIIRDAVAIEKDFICDALPCALIGMNSGMMSTYIEMISLQGKTNFFEKKVTDYQKSGVMSANAGGATANAITFDEEF